MQLTIEVLVIVVLVIGNGLFSMAELAVMSSRRSRLEHWHEEGNKQAGVALAILDKPTPFLATIQIGITLIGILAGAYGGATLSNRLAAQLGSIPGLAPYSDIAGFIITVSIITYLSLIIGELVPKRLALSDPERIAVFAAGPMNLLTRVVSPFVTLMSHSTDFILKIANVKTSEEPQITEEEIQILIRQGAQSGTVEASEQEMLERIFRLGDRTVSSVMTPRTKIIWLNLEHDPATNLKVIQESAHTRFPVCKSGLDSVIGIIQDKDLLNCVISSKGLNLQNCLKKPLYVPENMSVLGVLEMFKQSGNNIALVSDEYGVLQGLVTLHDVLEEIVGDIQTIDNDGSAKAVQREDGSWLVDGMMPIEDFMEITGMDEMPEDEEGDYQTLAGFILARLERIPMTADHFEWEGYQFEVVDMDGNRIDKVLVQLPRRASEEASDPVVTENQLR